MDNGKMIEALNRIADGQERQITAIKSVQGDISEIKDSIRRIDSRLEKTAEKTTVNTEKLKYLEKEVDENKTECGKERQNMWTKIRNSKEEAVSEAQRNVMLKIYAAALAAVGSLVVALIGYFKT